MGTSGGGGCSCERVAAIVSLNLGIESKGKRRHTQRRDEITPSKPNSFLFYIPRESNMRPPGDPPFHRAHSYIGIQRVININPIPHLLKRSDEASQTRAHTHRRKKNSPIAPFRKVKGQQFKHSNSPRGSASRLRALSTQELGDRINRSIAADCFSHSM